MHNKSFDDLQRKAASLHEKAFILRERGDWDEALRLFQQALEVEEEIGDLYGKSKTLHQIADIYASTLSGMN